MTEPSRSHGQKYLGPKGLIALITVLSAFIPLSTDLYLPALPGMAQYFNVSTDLANLTLILFFVFFSGGTLFWGPLSDKYGRKPILVVGLCLYFLASMALGITNLLIGLTGGTMRLHLSRKPYVVTVPERYRPKALR